VVQEIIAVIGGMPVGGMEKMLVNIVDGFDRSNFHFAVLSLSQDNPLASDLDPAISTFTAIPRRWRYDLDPARELRSIIRSRQVDVVWCLGLYEFFFVRVALQGLAARPRVVISIQSTYFAKRRQYLQHWLYARLLTGKEELISACNAQADFWTKAFAIPRSRFITVYNGVDVEHFKPRGGSSQRASIRAQYGIPMDKKVLLMVGRFHTGKRHEDALLALHWLSQHGSVEVPYLMFVGGRSPQRELQMRTLASELGLQDRVIFCGPQSDVRPFYEAADVFVLTSTVETFSVATLEAMAMGLPCVLTDTSGAREMISDGVNGFIVPARDPQAIAAGWQQALEQRSRFDSAAIRQRTVAYFRIEDCVKRYEMLLGSSQTPIRNAAVNGAPRYVPMDESERVSPPIEEDVRG
jgi:glycosyltransferase involved in cell wall biosynthesis